MKLKLDRIKFCLFIKKLSLHTIKKRKNIYYVDVGEIRYTCFSQSNNGESVNFIYDW